MKTKINDQATENLLSLIKKAYEKETPITFSKIIKVATSQSGILCHQAICDVFNGVARERGIVDNGLDMIAPSWVLRDAHDEPMMPWDSELTYDRASGAFSWSGADGPSGGNHMTISIAVQSNDKFRVF